jgi:hypothetical protein
MGEMPCQKEAEVPLLLIDSKRHIIITPWDSPTSSKTRKLARAALA